MNESDGFRSPKRTKCPTCKGKLSPCVKITNEGVEGKIVMASFCATPTCIHFVDLSVVRSWKKV